MLPNDVADEAERLTRRAREAVDQNEVDGARRRRDKLLSRHGYTARERTTDATLVLYPRDWIVDGQVRIDRVENTDRAIERPLEAPGDDANWEAIETHNREIVERITERYGRVHGENAATFADFMGNHYAKPIEQATEQMCQEFLREYFPRNTWSSKKQHAIVEQSVELTLDIARE